MIDVSGGGGITVVEFRGGTIMGVVVADCTIDETVGL